MDDAMKRQETVRLVTRDEVADALNCAWDDFCADTGYHPDCLTRRGRKLFADFRVGNFAEMVAGWLNIAVGQSVLAESEMMDDETEDEMTATGWELDEDVVMARANLRACAYNAAVNYGSGREKRKMAHLLDAINHCE